MDQIEIEVPCPKEEARNILRTLGYRRNPAKNGSVGEWWGSVTLYDRGWETYPKQFRGDYSPLGLDVLKLVAYSLK